MDGIQMKPFDRFLRNVFVLSILFVVFNLFATLIIQGEIATHFYIIMGGFLVAILVMLLVVRRKMPN